MQQKKITTKSPRSYFPILFFTLSITSLSSSAMSKVQKLSSTYFKDYVASNNSINKLFKQQAFVNGKFINSQNNKTFEITDPASGEILGTCPDMNKNDVKQTIDIAKVLLYFFPVSNINTFLTNLRATVKMISKNS